MRQWRPVLGFLLAAVATAWYFDFFGLDLIEKLPEWWPQAALFAVGLVLLFWNAPPLRSAMTRPTRSMQRWWDKRRARPNVQQLRATGLQLAHRIAKWEADWRREEITMGEEHMRFRLQAGSDEERRRLWNSGDSVELLAKTNKEAEFREEYADEAQQFLNEINRRGYDLDRLRPNGVHPPYAGIDPFGEISRSIEALARQLPTS